ncbi:MAG: threonine/serine exporter family protein [Lachnospiraceae bacterium]|nr:threonine/serine exporter family protein [Lachnospiraceae bacterium]
MSVNIENFSHSDTKEILTLAVEVGDTLLRNGGEIYRVEDTILHILNAYGIEHCDVYVLSNGIFASANEDREDGCSIVRHVPLGGVHLGKIAAINQLSREIVANKCTLTDAWERLNACKALPPTKTWIRSIFCGIGCACFAYIFGGTLIDAISALFLGMLLECMLLYMSKRKSSKFITNIIGSAFVTAGSLLLLNLGFPVMQDKIVIGDIMPLVPGIALTTSIRDLFNGDYLSGAIHLMDALLTAMCIAVGVGTVIILYRYIPGGVILQ